MHKKSSKPAKALPSWIVITAKDPKLAKAIEDKLADELSKTDKPRPQ
jgi:hypothetical protein